MKRTELRIGNYVDLYGSTAEVQREDFCRRKDKGITIDNGKPIKITEDWLENLGLEKSKFDFYYFHGEYERGGRFVLVPMRNTWTLFLNDIEGLEDYMELFASFKYVHELQNLYYVLTGQELKIK